MSIPSSSDDTLLATQAFQAFRHLLATGQVRAGQMVSMAELMKLSDFPLAPVREAVKRAAAAGLVLEVSTATSLSSAPSAKIISVRVPPALAICSVACAGTAVTSVNSNRGVNNLGKKR